MSRTEIEQRWEAALSAADRAVTCAIGLRLLSPSAAAETRRKLAQERKELHRRL